MAINGITIVPGYNPLFIVGILIVTIVLSIRKMKQSKEIKI